MQKAWFILLIGLLVLLFDIFILGHPNGSTKFQWGWSVLCVGSAILIIKIEGNGIKNEN